MAGDSEIFTVKLLIDSSMLALVVSHLLAKANERKVQSDKVSIHTLLNGSASVDLVIIDQGIGQDNAVDHICRIRKTPKLRSKPIIVLINKESGFQRLKRVGASGVIRKPVSLDGMVTLVQKLTSLRDAA